MAASPVIVFLLTLGNATVDPSAIVESHKRLMPGAAPLTIDASDPRAMQISAGDDLHFFLAAMPKPVPNGEAEAKVQFSVSGLGSGWKLPAHGGHFILAYQGDSALRRDHALTVFTTVAAAVAESAKAVGIYWGPAGATHEPKFFREIATRASAQPPVMLWAGVSLVRSGGVVSLLSRGLPEQLGLPDLLLEAPGKQGNEALGFFFELLDYVVRRNAPLADGETVGRSPTEKLPVRYVPSPAGGEAKVMRVELK